MIHLSWLLVIRVLWILLVVLFSVVSGRFYINETKEIRARKLPKDQEIEYLNAQTILLLLKICWLALTFWVPLVSDNPVFWILLGLPAYALVLVSFYMLSGHWEAFLDERFFGLKNKAVLPLANIEGHIPH